MDNFAAFPLASPAMLAVQQEIARRVDLVTYSARTLEEYARDLNPKHSLHLPNGVNFTHFADDHRPSPAEYAHIPRPIAVYVGALDFWFDFNLLETVARRLPEVSFVLIGPDDLARTKLSGLPNLYLLGRRNYAEIPAYLAHADVGLMPFNASQYPALVNSVHPLKLYEYLACGLPVVATDWEELRHLDSPASLCRTADEFAQAIAQSVCQPGHSADRINFARNADWSQRVKLLIENLDLPAGTVPAGTS
jgi:glycosyltransferase involved in cell wall biosynthesis